MAGFEWGGRFWGPGQQSEFSSWLSARGANYTDWARTHPGAAASFGTDSRSASSSPSVGGTTAASAPVNYGDLIQNDPVFGQIKADLAGQGISDEAQRAAAVRQALIGFGEVPELQGLSAEQSGWFGRDVDQSTRDLAAKNTSEGLSLTARLSKAHADAIRSLRNQLAARGMLRSGELTHGLSEEALKFKQGGFDARQSLLGAVGGVYGSFSSAQAQRQRELAQAMMDAASRQQQLLGASGASTQQQVAATSGGTQPYAQPGGTVGLTPEQIAALERGRQQRLFNPGF